MFLKSYCIFTNNKQNIDLQSSSWNVARRKNLLKFRNFLHPPQYCFSNFHVFLLEQPPLITPIKLCQDLQEKEKINWIFPLLTQGRKRGTHQRNLTGEVGGWQIYISTQKKRPRWFQLRMERSGIHFREVRVFSGLCSRPLASPGLVTFLVILSK